MLISKNKPEQEAEKRIFNQDAPLLVALGILALVLQIISGFTEYLGLREVFIPPLGYNWGRVAAGLVAFSIEYAVLFLVVYIVNAIYDGYLTSTDYSDKVRKSNKVKFGLMATLLTILVCVSMFLSKNNTRQILSANPIAAKTEDTGKYDRQASTKIAKIEKRYKSDLSKLNKGSGNLQSKYDAKVKALELDYKNLERKEQRTGKSYMTRKTNVQKDIQRAKEQLADALQVNDNAYAQSVASLRSRRDKAISNIEDYTTKRKGKIETRNDHAIDQNIDLNALISDFIVSYAQFAVLGFLIISTWICLSLNTAGIRPRVFIKPEMLEGSLVQEAWLLLSTSITRPLRNSIRRRLKQIPDLESIEEGAVINVSNHAKVIPLPEPPSIPKVSGPVHPPVFIPIPMPAETPVSKPVSQAETGAVSDPETTAPKQAETVVAQDKSSVSAPSVPTGETVEWKPKETAPKPTVSKPQKQRLIERDTSIQDWKKYATTYYKRIRNSKSETARDRNRNTFQGYRDMLQEVGINIVEHETENRITFHETARS